MSTARSASTPRIVGRDREITVGSRLVHEAIAGRGALLLISGEAGIGKTALAAHYHRQFAGPKLWLSLDSSDNHAPRLLAHLALALGIKEPEGRSESEWLREMKRERKEGNAPASPTATP